MISTKLKVVIWKKFVTRKRHWLLTLLELLMPLVTFILFVVFVSEGLSPSREYMSRQYNYGYAEDVTFTSWNKYLLYSPKNEFSDDIMNRTAVKLRMEPTHIMGFDSNHDLLEFYRKTSVGVYTAIVFQGDNEKEFDYIIGIEMESVDDTLYLQRSLDLSFIERISGKALENRVAIKVKSFPYAFYYRSAEYTLALPLAILLGFVFLYPSVLKCVVEEKQSGMKELMKMAGMQSWMLWLGWLMYALVSVILAAIFIIILLKVGPGGYPSLAYTDGSIFFIYLLLFGIAAIAFCFAISSFFTRLPIAITAGVVIWIISYVIPSVFLNSSFTKETKALPWIAKMLICLLPNMCLQYGCMDIADYEVRGIGVQWTNFHKPGSNTPNNLSMLNVFFMFILDTVLYTLFTFYMDRVNPGKYGVRRPILYPIYSLAELIMKLFKKEFQLESIPYETIDSIEAGDGLQKGIQIRKLCKNFGDKLAVNNMDLDIYKNQITILLGHNGAGKTTTMSMITGMLTPTTGSVLFSGKDLRNNMDVLRKSLGMCPQHNLFCSDFTVQEHLIFFAMLKGRSSVEAKEETRSVLEALKLYDKKHSRVDTLSGGMKRKLSLGMAIVGDPNVLVLDEPTAGMDPESRREIWDLLLSWRENKTILLTTHFMEEADALGDWIAIMANGTLQCYGTPMYLKRKYDTGYHLSLMISGAREEKDAIMANIFRHIEEAKIRDSTANNMVFVLPFENKMKIAVLLEFLEENKDNLKIENVSLTVTTLEDVFLKAKMEIESGPAEDNNSNQLLFQVFTTSEPPTTKRVYTWSRTVFALVKKRAQFFRRRFFMYLLPVLLMLALFLIVTFTVQTVGRANTLDDIGPLEPLNLKNYKDTEVYYNGSKVDFVQKVKSYYKETIMEYGGRPLEVENIDLAIQKKMEENFIYSMEYIVVGATFNEFSPGIKAIVHYNWDGNGQKVSLHLVMNAIAKAYLGGAYSITTSLWRHSHGKAYRTLQSEVSAIMSWYAAVPLGFLFVLANFIIFPHAEETTTFKHLQYMSGVTPCWYWIVNFLSDLFVYTVIAIFVAAYLDLTYSLGAAVFGLMLLVLFGCGFGSIPLTYLFSRKKSSAGAYGLFITLAIFLVVILSVGVTLAEVSRDSSSGNLFKVLSVLLVPPISLVYTGTKLVSWSYLRPHVMDSIVEDFELLLLSGILYLVVNILIDTYLIRKLTRRVIRSALTKLGTSSDIHIRRQSENMLVVENLHKVFSKKHIVKGISFALNEGQCLGILGVNGAGKTTTFRMLTREIIADEGTVELVENGRHIHMDKNEYVEKLGYCPQSDALNSALSARQTLSLFATLRSLDHKFVNVFLKMFELEEFADIPCSDYSGGNKRKLNLAVALLGHPKYVLLDEPTNGVDPSSRRKFWKLIRSFQENMGVSFILTSHSMVECEALCSYMMIMKAGRFVKEGTIADLKRGIGGFSIKLKLMWKECLVVKERKMKRKSGDEVELKSLGTPDTGSTLGGIEELKSYFINVYNAEIKDEHSGLLHFYIKDKNKTWSALFKEIETLKMGNPHLIEDYVISEATLEDVFLSVAREI